MNLLSNAKDALTQRSDGQIRIDVEKTGEFIVLSVADNGTGIPAEIRERIFNPFFTTKPVGQGTGIGLALSQNLALEMGAKISVTSEMGQGAKFTVQFPFAIGEATKGQFTQKSKSITEIPEIDSLTVLVVDDEDGVREIFKDFLTLFGVTKLMEAPSGAGALKILESHRVDLLLTDMQMPGMSGLELIKKIREGKLLSTPVCFIVTGGIATSFEKATREELSKMADGYILKPFSRVDLELPLKLALSKRRL